MWTVDPKETTASLQPCSVVFKLVLWLSLESLNASMSFQHIPACLQLSSPIQLSLKHTTDMTRLFPGFIQEDHSRPNV